MDIRRCRACDASLEHTLVDLGLSPLANSYVSKDRAHEGEKFYPLHVFVCGRCHLVQLEQFETPENIFSHYAYFSSFSSSWLHHCKTYALEMTRRWSLDGSKRVVEVASNDGYLLQYFADQGISVLGIEPAANVARVANEKGIPTEVAFFGRDTATALRDRGFAADLMAANNVLAHVPNIRDFIAGFAVLLKPQGIATFEFPHLLEMVKYNQFDTIYHEHFSYLSVSALLGVLAENGLRVFDIEQLATHGGSLRVFVCLENASHEKSSNVDAVLGNEEIAGLTSFAAFDKFAPKTVAMKCDALEFLINARRAGKRVIGYGAAAKGNTFLNYCGIGPELIEAVADRSPHKQETLLPGSRIAVISPDELIERRPDYVVILPWNLRTEIVTQLDGIKAWGGRFVTFIPELQVH